MELFSAEVIGVVGRTIGIFLWAFILLRMLGRRRLAHLTYIDLLLIIAFGSAVGDVMIYPESTVHFLTSVLAITTVALMVKILDEVSSHSVLGSRVIDGQSQIIIERGRVIDGVMERENLTQDDLLALLRQSGVDAVHKVRWAYLETDGELSVAIYKKYKN